MRVEVDLVPWAAKPNLIKDRMVQTRTLWRMVLADECRRWKGLPETTRDAQARGWVRAGMTA